MVVRAFNSSTQKAEKKETTGRSLGIPAQRGLLREFCSPKTQIINKKGPVLGGEGGRS